MKHILIRKDFYKSVVLEVDEVFINAFKRLENCKEILDQIKKDSIEAYVNGYDQYKLEYRISHNLFWRIHTTPQTLQKSFLLLIYHFQLWK
jgi:hypothetical protein